MSLCGSEVEGDNAEGFALPLSQKRKKNKQKTKKTLKNIIMLETELSF